MSNDGKSSLGPFIDEQKQYFLDQTKLLLQFKSIGTTYKQES
jgi:hypothetical protein